MKTKQTPAFEKMPKDYAGLCRLFLPRPIHDRVACENTIEVADAFAGFEERMNSDQNDYFDLLCSLIADYERVKQPKLRGVDLLKHLVDEHGLSGAELSRILGKSVALGPMILRKQRSITANHARKLGEYFGLPAGSFLG